MRVRMRSLSATPARVAAPGQVVDVGADEATALVRAGFATYVDPPAPEPAEASAEASAESGHGADRPARSSRRSARRGRAGEAEPGGSGE